MEGGGGVGGGSAEVEGDRDQEQDTHHPTLQVHGDTPSIYRY